MSSRSRKRAWRIGAAALLAAAAPVGATDIELRVCAEPDNLPYSRRDESGFENRIAQLVAGDMGATLRYFWQEQRLGFVRKTMGAGLCDVFIGVPAGFERVLRTRPYYRSTYVAVRRAADPPFAGFDTAQVRQRRLGVQLIGNDLAASPPGHALVLAGAVDNVTGFLVYGDGPAGQRMVEAVATGAIDVAFVWGPQAGYFARRGKVPLAVQPIEPPAGLPDPFTYAIAMGVPRHAVALRDRLDEILQRRKPDIDAILAEYDVPRAAPSPDEAAP